MPLRTRLRTASVLSRTGSSAPSGSVTGASSRVNLTTGDLTCSATTWAAMTASALDITLGNATSLPITAGMKLEIHLNGFTGSATPGLFFDIATIVSAAPVNFISGLANASNTDAGVQGWRAGGSTNTNASGGVLYTVQAGDISAGTVLLRPYWVLSTAGSRSILANTNAPLMFWAKVSG